MTGDLFDWRAHVQVHPAAEEFPLLEGSDLTELTDDIKANRLRERITFWVDPDSEEGFLLDGRNRLNALAQADLLTVDDQGRLCQKIFDGQEWSSEPVISTYRQGDPYKIVASLNVHRRHLEPERKREIIARLLKAKPKQSNRAIAQEAGVDHKTVNKVRTKMEDVGTIPHGETRTDSKGRKQPATKPKPIKTKPKATEQKKAHRSSPQPLTADDRCRAQAVPDRVHCAIEGGRSMSEPDSEALLYKGKRACDLTCEEAIEWLPWGWGADHRCSGHAELRPEGDRAAAATPAHRVRHPRAAAGAAERAAAERAAPVSILLQWFL
jgi:hypothetical protein